MAAKDRSWSTYCKEHGLVKTNRPYSLACSEDRFFCFASKEAVMEDETLNSLRSRTYVLLGDNYIYAGITATLQTRVNRHERAKPFDNVFWLECPNVYFSPVDVSMLEKALFAAFKKSEKEGLFDVFLEPSEMFEQEGHSSDLPAENPIALGNKSKPSMHAYAPGTIHFKSDKWLLDSFEGFLLYLKERGYPICAFDETEVLSAMRSEQVDNSFRGRWKRLFDPGSQVENVIESRKRNYRRTIVLLVLFLMSLGVNASLLVALGRLLS